MRRTAKWAAMTTAIATAVAMQIVVAVVPAGALTPDERFTAYDDAAIAITEEVGWLVRLAGLVEPVPPSIASIPDAIGLPVLSRPEMIEALRRVDEDGPRVLQGLTNTGDPQSAAVQRVLRRLEPGTLDVLAAGANPMVPGDDYELAYGEIIDAWFPLFDAGARRVSAPDPGAAPTTSGPPTASQPPPAFEPVTTAPLSSPGAAPVDQVAPVDVAPASGVAPSAASAPSGGGVAPRPPVRTANATDPAGVTTAPGATGATGATAATGASGATAANGAASTAEPGTERATEDAAATSSTAGGATPIAALAGAGAALLAVVAGVWVAVRRRSRPRPGAGTSGAAPVDADDLFELSRVLPTLRTPEAVAAHAVDVVRGVVGSGAAIAVVDAELVPLSGELRIGESALRPVLDAGSRVCRTAGEHSFVAAPLVTAGRVCGAVVVSRTGPAFPAGIGERVGQVATIVASSLQAAFHHRDAERLAYIDGLTQVANRRRFDLDLGELLRDARTGATPMSLAMVDIDHFKRLNDDHGHQTGDAVLRQVAATIAANVRRDDVVYRYGGEEFAILLPGADTVEAAEVVERVRDAVQCRQMTGERGEALAVTVSVGVARSMADEPGDLLAAADGALYEAKGGGRNRVVIAGR